MGIQRAATLYPVNSTTVDTGGGGSGDIRLLAATDTGAAPGQTCTATHTQDNQSRTFDPANFGVTANQNPGLIQHRGWALRLSDDMTPADDTNCNSYLPAGTGAILLNVTIDQSGGTYLAGTYGPLWAWALFKYNPSTDASTLITFGTSNTTTWTIVLGDLGTYKTINIPVVIAAGVEFAAGEILLLQIGLGVQTIPNPTLGTATWTFTLRVDLNGTRIDWGTIGGLRQVCALASNNVGAGVPTRVVNVGETRNVVGAGVPTAAKAAALAKASDSVGAGVVTHTKAGTKSASLIGDGIPTEARAVEASKSFDLVGDGVVTRVLALALEREAVVDGVADATTAATVVKSFDLIGDGLVTETDPVQAYWTFDLLGDGIAAESRVVLAEKSFDLAADGVVTRALALELARDTDGEGLVTETHTTAASKMFDLVGEGLVTEEHPVAAARTFDLVADGLVSGRIEIPIDEVPTGGGGGDPLPDGLVVLRSDGRKLAIIGAATLPPGSLKVETIP